MSDRWVGRPMRRREDDRLIRGAGRYVADLPGDGDLHVAFVRSPLPHARIAAIDASRATALSGVAGVFTAQDLPRGPMPPFLWDRPNQTLVETLEPFVRSCHPPLLAEDRVRFVGQAVAVVVAESRYVAEDAAQLVEVELDPLPPVATLEEALAPDAPIVHDGWTDNVAVRFTVSTGDPAAALSSAYLVVDERFEVQRQAGLPLETRGAIGRYDDRTGRLTLWSATQNAHPLRRALGRVAGIDEERIRVIAPDVGGGFGVKGVLYPEDLIVGLLAIRLRRSVRWVEDRVEHLQSAIHAREQSHHIRLGLAADGTVLGLVDHFLVDAGAFNPLGMVVPYNTIAHLTGPYRIPAMEAVGTCVITTKVPTAPYRGAGRPEAVFAFERAMDRAAALLHLDPVELRRKNLVRPDEMPYPLGILYRDGVPAVLDSGDYPELLGRATALIQGDAAEAERAEERRRGRLVGTGIAAYVEGTAIGPFESAMVTLEPTGTFAVRAGACSQGQGHETILAQVCADALGVSPDAIAVTVGDTEGLERGWGTVASRSAVVAGNAVANAASRVRSRILEAAADLLETAAEDLTLSDGSVVVVGAPDRSIALSALAERVGQPLAETDHFEPPTVTWAAGVHAASISIDPATGELKILRYAVAHDCGPVINPTIVEGQIHGGVAQGVAGALYEEVVYGEDAQLMNATLADYLVPTASEIPPILLDHLETPSPLNPLGLKGVGEGGAIPVGAALANAAERALASGGHDVVIRRTPLSPAYLRSLIAGGA
ncbi:MAG: xanthine dehydrogenase family protein molybdopterin-binding subunit [Candidatus Velamenicoccus archaeovorus]